MLAVLALTPNAFGQADHPNLQGANERPGHNSDPANYNSGIGFLQWFTPYGVEPTTSLIVDNTDLPANWTTYGGTYNPNIYGFASLVNATNGGANPFLNWQGPANVSNEATDPFIEYANTTSTPPNYSFRTPDYVYVGCTPSSGQTTPTVAATPNNLATFTWSFLGQTGPPNYITNPPSGAGNAWTAQNYALYVWIPIGPTLDPTQSFWIYPQEFFVYQISYGNGQTYTDVVDTYLSGGGWVRLGNGGGATNAVFPWNGSSSNPIQIKLLNTIPYTPKGVLSGSTSQCVYADAAMAVPISGTYNASPVSAYLRDAAGNPQVDAGGDPDVLPAATSGYFARILSAENMLVQSSNSSGQILNNLQGQVRCYQMNPQRWTTPPTVGGANGVPTVLWNYSPLAASNFSVVMTNGTPTAGFTQDTTNPNYQGPYYYSSPLSNVGTTNGVPNYAAATDNVLYQPSLGTGAYSIYAYIPGNAGGETYGDQVIYTIWEGNYLQAGATPAYVGTLNEQNTGGWVQLGIRGYNNAPGNLGQLTVVIYNGSTDNNDVGKLAYANAIKFVGAANLQINSTPVIAQVVINKNNNTSALTQVAIVADEAGRIHCLDYLGNGDGTTTEYWCYPSTPDPNNPNWTDPNLTSGIDGTSNSTVPVAQMPYQFNLSTAVVVHNVQNAVTSPDRLYIASTNGRIYSLDMAGRGDYTAKLPGTTQRLWSYPDDFPATIIKPARLGPFRGSLVYGDTTDGLTAGTILAAAPQGRVYSLDALGNQTTRTTTVNWTFPALTAPVIPPIEMTPSLMLCGDTVPRLFFGTHMGVEQDTPGTFYGLNAATGKVSWYFNGVTNGANTGNNIPVNSTGAITPGLDSVTSWTTGPASVPLAMLQEPAAPYTVTTQDTVYALNDNLHLYGFNAQTGQIANSTDGTRPYDDSELGVTSVANLGFEWMSVYDRTGGVARRSVPVVTVPTTEGHLYGLFANTDDYNAFSGQGAVAPATNFTSLICYGYGTVGSNVTSEAFSNNRMIAHDDWGYMYVWDNNTGNYGIETPGTPPGGAVSVPGQPGPADAFRYLHIKFVDRATYNALRNITVNAGTGAASSATETYQNILAAQASPPKPAGAPNFSFEWGQTMYIVVYGFNYAIESAAGNPVTPPVANIRISVGGHVIRQLQVDSSEFSQSTASPALYAPFAADLPWPASWSGLQDGYAVIAFTPQNAGPNALPPGTASITADLTTAAPTGTSQEIASDPNPTSPDVTSPDGGTISFNMDNPLAIQMGGQYATGPAQDYLMGAFYGSTITTNSYDLASQVNGSPLLPNYTPAPAGTYQAGGTSFYYDQLMESTGYSIDGAAATATINVYDRSLMTLIRPQGLGLDLLRMDRTDMQWQGGALTVFNPLNSTLYPGFEDSPVNSPNDSLDYPNLTQDNVQFQLNPSGTSYNPLLQGASLTPPTDPNGATLTESSPDASVINRLLVPTPLTITVNLPRYLPGNNWTAMAGNGGVNVADDVIDYQKYDSAQQTEPQGYFGTVHLFIDSQGSGSLSTQDSYRTLHLASGVVPSWRILVDTPSVDLGNLSATTGYSPSNPGAQTPPDLNNTPSAPFNPWNGTWKGVYKSFTVLNEGNINDLHIRPAKAEDVFGVNGQLNLAGGNAILPWPILSGGNDVLAWLDSSLDSWSNLDAQWALPFSNATTPYPVMIQKPRVTDQVGHALDPNPHARLNSNTGTPGNGPDLNTAYDPTNVHSPLIGVSIPFGFPAGTYSTALKLIEDSIYPPSSSPPTTTTSGSQFPQVWDPLVGYNATEPFSDPGLNLSFTVGETQVTNTNSPNTVGVADNFGTGPNPATMAWTNTTPGAMRDAFGSVIVAWESNRPSANTQVNNNVPSADIGKIYVSSVSNAANFGTQTGTGITGLATDPITGQTLASPLADLSMFSPGANSWMTSQTANGFPAASLFPNDTYGTDTANLDKYDRPAFPADGERNPLWQTLGPQNWFFTSSLMAFVGTGHMSTGAVESKVFVTPVTTSQGGGVSFGTPVSTSDAATGFNDDPTTPKGKPSLVQTSNTGGLVFYGATQAGRTAIHSARFTGSAFGQFVPLNFGPGFDNVDDPSAVARPYLGANPALHPAGNLGTPGQIIDLTFGGKLKGRPNSEIYLGRLMYAQLGDGTYHLVDANGNDEEQAGAGSPFAFMPQQVNERLLNEGNGQFRARGVEWDRTQPITLSQYSATSGQPTNVLDNSTRVVDRQSGLITYDTYNGGKVSIDPDLGTLRFTTSPPAQNVELRLTYTPAFLRVTNGGPAAYSGPQEVYDDHYIGDNSGSSSAAGANYAEWFNTNGTGAVPSANIQSHRSMFLFGKAASGQGQTARPFMTTMRFGLRLPTRIATVPGGAPVSVQVTGNSGPYELDPANGRVYFTAVDEDNSAVQVTYTGVNEADGSQITGLVVQGTISYVLEKDETPVLMSAAVNEGSLAAFLDPFTYPNNSSLSTSRPPLVWMFYTSTRGGGQDVFFQTIAPSLLPVVK